MKCHCWGVFCLPQGRLAAILFWGYKHNTASRQFFVWLVRCGRRIEHIATKSQIIAGKRCVFSLKSCWGMHHKKKRCIPVCILLRRQPQRTDGIQAEMHRVYGNTHGTKVASISFRAVITKVVVLQELPCLCYEIVQISNSQYGLFLSLGYGC